MSWEPTVYECEDDVPGRAISTCCGAPEGEAPLGMCTVCKEHCDWYDEEEEEPEDLCKIILGGDHFDKFWAAVKDG